MLCTSGFVDDVTLQYYYDFKRMPFGIDGDPATAKLMLVEMACSVRYKSRRQSLLSTTPYLDEKMNDSHTMMN